MQHGSKSFPRVIQKYTKSANFTEIQLQYFATKLHNCTKIRILFPAVLINFPNSKVCLIGERSIHRIEFGTVHCNLLSQIH